jgi:hypothetical protein
MSPPSAGHARFPFCLPHFTHFIATSCAAHAIWAAGRCAGWKGACDLVRVRGVAVDGGLDDARRISSMCCMSSRSMAQNSGQSVLSTNDRGARTVTVVLRWRRYRKGLSS